MSLPLPPIHAGTLTRRSRLPFHWTGHRFSLTALSGQAATLARTTTATPADVNGTTRTVVHSQPAWELKDWDGDATRDTPTLMLGANDTCYWTVPMLPAACTVFLEFVQPASMPAASATVFYLGNSGNTGARLWIDSTGTYYRANHHNGSTSVTSTLSAAPTSAQRVRLRLTLDSSGRVQLHQSINGAGESSASQSGTNTLAAAWSDTRLYANSTGATNPASTFWRRCRVAYGNLTAAQMLVAW